jgi:ATP dependent DNA ligase-like protein
MLAKAPFFEPMLCDNAEQPPEGPEWRYELKLDGYRAIGFRSEGQAQLWSRNGKDFVRRFPEIAKAIESLPEDTAIDGEIVALDADGKPSFALLHGSGAGAVPMVFYVFDLLMLRGMDLRLSRFEERRKRLRKIVDRLPASIRYSETFEVPQRRSCEWSGRMARRHSRETGGQYVPFGPLGRLAQVAGESRTRARDWRIRARFEHVRFAFGWLLRRPRPHVCRAHSSGSGAGVQASTALFISLA